MSKINIERPNKKEKISYHLWGIRKPHKSNDCKELLSCNFYNTWSYIRECTADRRAIMGIDTRIYSQLEVRSNIKGKLILRFVEDDG